MVTELREVLFAVPKFTPEQLAEGERRAREREEYNRQQAEYERDRAFDETGCCVTDEVREALRKKSLSDTSSHNAIKSWWNDQNNKHPWLVLSGTTGCGKSVAVARLLHGRGYGRLVRADELVRLFSSMFGEQYEKQGELREAGILAIDDVGGELDSVRMLPALLDLLDTRCSVSSRKTIVTTNLTPKAFRERYANERLMSRMAELVRWENVAGDDLRRVK